MIGRTLAQYEILEKLGEGGMGVVYKARDTRLGRLAAIKFLAPDKVSDPARKQRFVEEARAASALNHPNIITIYDIGDEDGAAFIAMEYVTGRTLADAIPRKGCKFTDVLKYGIQIADALARAHAAGILHRDLKPGNIMVTGDGLVKVLDFGLAKLLPEGGSSGEEITRTLRAATAEGTVVGTAPYMSPEQASGGKVDARSDIFSFGAVLYEMIAGRRPFDGDSNVSIMAAVLEKEPAPLPPETPRDLMKVVTRCLRKDPERRWQTMADVRVALAEIKEESDSGALAAAPARRRRRWLWPAAGVAAGLIAAAALWFFLRGEPESAPVRVVPLTTYNGTESDPSFSPDGSQVAFSWNGPKADNADIYVKQVGEESVLRLTSNPLPDVTPAWSPDGRSIAFARRTGNGAEYYLIPALGGPERKIADTAGQRSDHIDHITRPRLCWSPDGKWIALGRRASPEEPFAIFLLSLETGEMRRLTTPPARTFGDSGAAFSPSGDALIFGRAFTYGVSELFLLALHPGYRPKGEPRQLTFDRLWANTPAWTADGRSIVFSSGPATWTGGIRGLWQLPLHGNAKPRRLPFTGEQKVNSLAISARAHRLAYARDLSDEDIYRVDLAPGAGAEPRAANVISSTYTDHNAQYSPDGSRIVFISSRSGRLEIWTAASDGSGQAQLTSMNAPVTGSPRWSPDGETIVFDSNVEGQFDVYSVSRNGGKPRRLTTNPADDALASFSADGRYIYFGSNRSGDWQIWRMLAGGGDPVQITRQGGRVPFEAPGTGFLYYTKAANVTSLWKVPAGGGDEEQVLAPVNWQQFCVVDDGVYFVPPAPGPARHDIVLYSFATRTTRTLAHIDGPLSFGLSISPDRRSALIAHIEQRGADLMLVENF